MDAYVYVLGAHGERAGTVFGASLGEVRGSRLSIVSGSEEKGGTEVRLTPFYSPEFREEETVVVCSLCRRRVRYSIAS